MPRRLAAPFSTVRMRTTLAAVAVVGVVLVAAAAALVLGLRASMTGNEREAARLRAEDIVAGLETGGSTGSFATADDEEMFVQVLDGQGSVVASSANVAGAPPLAMVDPGSSTIVGGLDDEEAGVDLEDGDFVVVAEAAGGERVVLAGRSLEVVGETTAFLVRVLAVAVPLLLVVVGLSVWWLTGRALSPVDSISREVERISGSDLSRRVPVPATEDEIARLAGTMNRMLDRLEGSAARQRRFVSDASHELRSPVASIRQYVEVALAHRDRFSNEELARAVLAEDLRLQSLVDDLLWLARADERGLTLDRREVDLDDLLMEEATRLRGAGQVRVDSRGIGAARVQGDPSLLRHLVRNLVDNAARHAREVVALSLREAGGEALLWVDDDGPGIAQADRERIFERFERLDGARARDGGGSGLGLSIAAEIAAAHRGSVSAQDSPLGGARFEIRLPALS